MHQAPTQGRTISIQRGRPHAVPRFFAMRVRRERSPGLHASSSSPSAFQWHDRSPGAPFTSADLAPLARSPVRNFHLMASYCDGGAPGRQPTKFTGLTVLGTAALGRLFMIEFQTAPEERHRGPIPPPSAMTARRCLLTKDITMYGRDSSNLRWSAYWNATVTSATRREILSRHLPLMELTTRGCASAGRALAGLSETCGA